MIESWLASTIVELASFNIVVDRLVAHVGTECSWFDERTDLNNVVATIMYDKSTVLFIHDRTCCFIKIP